MNGNHCYKIQNLQQFAHNIKLLKIDTRFLNYRVFLGSWIVQNLVYFFFFWGFIDAFGFGGSFLASPLRSTVGKTTRRKCLWPVMLARYSLIEEKRIVAPFITATFSLFSSQLLARPKIPMEEMSKTYGRMHFLMLSLFNELPLQPLCWYQGILQALPWSPG